MGIDPKKMVVVSIMPCTAKKFEVSRPEMVNDGCPNVDAVLTTRELIKLIKQSGIDFAALPDGAFDNPLGMSSGAADIFGATGGVMEAALRTVYELVTGRELPFEGLHVAPIVGLERIKTAAITITDPKKEFAWLDGVTVKIAVTSGLLGASTLLEEIKAGESEYLFIEVMGCPGGCIAGGRRYFHINARGDCEPCAFVHYATHNIHECTLVDALKSPLFHEYQVGQPFSDNLLRPCPLLDNPEALQKIIKKSGAHSTQPLDLEDVDTLTGKTIKVAEKWKVTADEMWEKYHFPFAGCINDALDKNVDTTQSGCGSCNNCASAQSSEPSK